MKTSALIGAWKWNFDRPTYGRTGSYTSNNWKYKFPITDARLRYFKSIFPHFLPALSSMIRSRIFLIFKKRQWVSEWVSWWVNDGKDDSYRCYASKNHKTLPLPIVGKIWVDEGQGGAEDFRIGVALTLIAREAREIFLSATPIFRLFVRR